MSSGNLLPTFRDKLTVPTSRVKESKKTDRNPATSPKRTLETIVRVLHYGWRLSFRIINHWKWDPIHGPETSVRNNCYKCVTTQASAVLINFAAESWNQAKRLSCSSSLFITSSLTFCSQTCSRLTLSTITSFFSAVALRAPALSEINFKSALKMRFYCDH